MQPFLAVQLLAVAHIGLHNKMKLFYPSVFVLQKGPNSCVSTLVHLCFAKPFYHSLCCFGNFAHCREL